MNEEGSHLLDNDIHGHIFPKPPQQFEELDQSINCLITIPVESHQSILKLTYRLPADLPVGHNRLANQDLQFPSNGAAHAACFVD